MKISQQVSHIREDRYRNDIEISAIPKGFFPAITTNTTAEASSTRNIIISLMPLEQSPGGTMNCATGRFQRRTQETSIKVTVVQDGKELVADYSSYD